MSSTPTDPSAIQPRRPDFRRRAGTKIDPAGCRSRRRLQQGCRLRSHCGAVWKNDRNGGHRTDRNGLLRCVRQPDGDIERNTRQYRVVGQVDLGSNFPVLREKEGRTEQRQYQRGDDGSHRVPRLFMATHVSEFKR